ncbi:MAG: homoserine dehydrogenase [Oscillospiraceae bacterium]|nr:homoserine dehydrogenase [Oscillospiraceae bacterium]
MISIAIIGHGVVGSGVAELLRHNHRNIALKAGEDIAVRHILDIRTFPDLAYADLFTSRFEDILNDPDVRVVVETMGGLHPAFEYVRACLEAGKSVVTSNKELVAEKGDVLLATAKERNVNFLFEASVGGGIPILRPLDQCLAANRVHAVTGILNGTTNFMLTRMFEDGVSFDEALKQAQHLGYAERNPAADIEGVDACRKISILASLAFGQHVYPNTVYTEGITHITVEDVKAAGESGGVLKLIGQAALRDDGRLDVLVAPMVVPKDSMLSEVRDVFNAIMVQGDAIGDVIFYGRGAGKMPTASAVVADVIDEVKHLKARKYLFWEKGDPTRVAPVGEHACAWLLRGKDGTVRVTEAMTEDAARHMLKEKTVAAAIRMLAV